MAEKEKWSPLKEMAETTPTDFWNDSCSFEELKYAISNGDRRSNDKPCYRG